MRNLTDIHQQLSANDQVYLEKQAEAIKIAEEEDAAGRIMARGFADELNKLAEPAFGGQPKNMRPNLGQGMNLGTQQSGGYNTGGGKTGPANQMGGAGATRRQVTPPMAGTAAIPGGKKPAAPPAIAMGGRRPGGR